MSAKTLKHYNSFFYYGKQRNQRKFSFFGKSVIYGIVLCAMTLARQIPFLQASEPVERTEMAEKTVNLFEKRMTETDFEQAKTKAKASRKNLLIYFYAEETPPSVQNGNMENAMTEKDNEDAAEKPIRYATYRLIDQKLPKIAEICDEFEQNILSEAEIASPLDDFVLARLPMETMTTAEDGSDVRLLDTPDFVEMQGSPGLATMDFTHEDEEYYGKVNGILPFLRDQLPSAAHLQAFLTLPAGTITQRTLIYAVRIHPEKPKSANTGEPLPLLFDECQGHAQYQAKTGVLGHQNFGARSSRIAAAIGLRPAEVCAVGWSNKGLFEAAIGSVRSWRGSPPHWASVRAKNRYYGYDMVRGRSGSWFAVGLFVK